MDPLSTLIFVVDSLVFDELSPMGLAMLKSVSRFIRRLVLRYEETAFSLYRLYGLFFEDKEDIVGFRSLQLRTGALVSGSSLVRFLSRSKFPPSDLDIFVNRTYVEELGRFLVGCGYSFVPLQTVVVGGLKVSEEQHCDFATAVALEWLKCTPNTGSVADRYEFTTIGGVFNFVHKASGMKVQLVSARTEPVEVIMGFYSTLVMNVATATEVISLYPRTSFVHYRSLYLKQGTRTVDLARAKYEARGWESYDEVSAEQFLRPWSEVSGNIRWVGDPHCWVYKLSPLRGGSEAVGLYRPLKVASWQLSSSAGSTHVAKNRMDNPALTRSYVLTWNAMMCVWHHGCFSRLRERSVLFRRGLPFDELSEDSDIGLKMLEGAALAGRALDASSGDVPVEALIRDARLDPAFIILGYTVTGRRCLHHPLVPPVMLDSAVIDFLSGLYPLLAAEHRHSWPVERLRDAFAGLRQLYPDEFGRSSYPTGHVVAMIMQCLEDLDISGLSDDVELQIEFALDRERDLITTTCDIVVSTECMLLLQREIPAWTWSEDYMGEAGLDVRLSAE